MVVLPVSSPLIGLRCEEQAGDEQRTAYDLLEHGNLFGFRKRSVGEECVSPLVQCIVSASRRIVNGSDGGLVACEFNRGRLKFVVS